MKREIFCKSCALQHQLGERRKYGKSIGNHLCDYCNQELPRGSDICCSSYMRDPEDYWPWEDESLLDLGETNVEKCK